jgi:hypothetical protein
MERRERSGVERERERERLNICRNPLAALSRGNIVLILDAVLFAMECRDLKQRALGRETFRFFDFGAGERRERR